VADGYRRLAEEDPERVRVIDAGGPPETVFQAALRELEDLLPATPREASPRPEELVRRIYAAWSSGDLAAEPELFHPDMELHAGWPGGGTAKGREPARRLIREFISDFSGFRLEAREFHTRGDRVLVIARMYGRGKESGLDLSSTDVGHVFTVRDGRVVRMFMSELAASRADFERPDQSP
jgi:ketosteroid isomerase-like protein